MANTNLFEMSPLEKQLVHRNIESKPEKLGNGYLPSPLPKLAPPVLRVRHPRELHFRMPLQPKMSI